MYDDSTGQPKLQGILVIIALIVALPIRGSGTWKEEAILQFSGRNEDFSRSDEHLGTNESSRIDSTVDYRFFLGKTGLA